MTAPVRTRSATAAIACAAAIAAFAPAVASAEDYDIDCKLLLCLPGGFPTGCGDAFDHMKDRLRDRKSPIGFCAVSNGAEYDAYEIDYQTRAVTTPQGWDCPEGKTLYHRVHSDDDDHGYWSQEVNTFCYDSAYTRRGWTADGEQSVTTYTNKTAPLRTDFWVDLTLEPGTPSEFSRGWQKFDTGRDFLFRVSYSE